MMRQWNSTTVQFDTPGPAESDAGVDGFPHNHWKYGVRGKAPHMPLVFGFDV